MEARHNPCETKPELSGIALRPSFLYSFTTYVTTASTLRHTLQQQNPYLRGSSPRRGGGL
jgi:hypothetical protein